MGVATTLLAIAAFLQKATGHYLYFRKAYAELQEINKPKGLTVGLGVSNGLYGDATPDPMVIVKVINMGDKPAKLTALIAHEYASRKDHKKRKPSALSFPRLRMDLVCQLPLVLEPGEDWTGVTPLASLSKDLNVDGLVYVGVQHNLEWKPALSTMRLADAPGPKPPNEKEFDNEHGG